MSKFTRLTHKHKHVTIHRAFGLLLCAKSLCKITTGLLTVRNATMTSSDSRRESSLLFGSFVDQPVCWLPGGWRRRETSKQHTLSQSTTQSSNVWEQFHYTIPNFEIKLREPSQSLICILFIVLLFILLTAFSIYCIFSEH